MNSLAKFAVLACIVLSMAGEEASAENIHFGLGVQGGWSDWTYLGNDGWNKQEEVPISGLFKGSQFSGGDVGIVSEIMIPFGGSGVSAGIQAGIVSSYGQSDTAVEVRASLTEQEAEQLETFWPWAIEITADDARAVNGNLNATFGTAAVIDILPTVAMNFGYDDDFQLTLGAGLSLQSGNLEFRIPNWQIFGIDEDTSSTTYQTFADNKWHLGWKVAPGLSVRLMEDIYLFGQFHYAEYAGATYRDYFLESGQANDEKDPDPDPEPGAPAQPATPSGPDQTDSDKDNDGVEIEVDGFGSTKMGFRVGVMFRF